MYGAQVMANTMWSNVPENRSKITCIQRFVEYCWKYVENIPN